MSDLHNTTVRLARLADASAITTIYNQGIEERNATEDYHVYSPIAWATTSRWMSASP
jgi:L-amino acid N-acyltransferase YncA